MVLKEKGTRFCRGGKVFTVSGRVLGNEACDYAGLHGVITGIYTGADGVEDSMHRKFAVILSALFQRK